MGELRITSVKGTNQSGKTQQKPQPKQKENIVIEFTSLPDNMKTAKVREFFDKDGSGFLESNNANGQNEVDLMQRAFGLDLSKYKSDITKVRTSKAKAGFWVGDTDGKKKYYPIETTSVGYNNENQKIVEIKHYQSRDFDKSKTFSPELLAHSQIFEKRYTSGKLSADNLYSRDYKPEATQTCKNGKTIWRFFYNDGYLEMSGQGDTKTIHVDKSGLYNNQGKLIQDLNIEAENTYYNKVEYKQLTNGQNRLNEKETYQIHVDEFPHSRMSHSIKDVLQGKAKRKVSGEYQFNGKPVQAKPIGKGRYEVTTEQGKVYYISHDGVNLNPDYVRKNP